jgi:hypothetical protein
MNEVSTAKDQPKLKSNNQPKSGVDWCRRRLVGRMQQRIGHHGRQEGSLAGGPAAVRAGVMFMSRFRRARLSGEPIRLKPQPTSVE